MEHEEEVVVVREEPLVVALKLPDGCTPGRWEAAESFADSIAELRRRYPGRTFQFVPFSYRYQESPALDTILAIAD